MTLVFFLIFFVLLLAGLPIAFALLAAPATEAVAHGDSSVLTQLVLRLYYGIDSFPLMALPFFILAGELMSRGGKSWR